MKFLRWLCLWLSIISGAIWATILLTYLLYPLFMYFEGLPQIAVMTFGRLYHNYLQLMAYLQLPWIGQLKMQDFPDSAGALQHFADVKKLFLLDIVIFILTTPLAVRFARTLRQKRQHYLLVRPFEIGAVVPVILGALMAVNFDAVFIDFHKILFRNDDWLFDPAKDPIISVLPESFFAACFVLALLLFELAMAVGIYRGRKDAQRDSLF